MQRRLREGYLNRLPRELNTYLENQKFITQPELELVFQKWRTVGENKEESSNQYFKSSTPWENEVLGAVSKLPSQHDSQSALMLIDAEDGAFELQFGWARKSFGELFKATRTKSLALFRADFRAGVFVDSYGGEYENNLSPDGVVYELEHWGFMRRLTSRSS